MEFLNEPLNLCVRSPKPPNSPGLEPTTSSVAVAWPTDPKVHNLVLHHQQLQQFEHYVLMQQQQAQADAAKTHLDKYLTLTHRYLDHMTPFLQCFAADQSNVQAAAQAAATLLLSGQEVETKAAQHGIGGAADSVKCFLNKLIEHNFVQQLRQQQQLNDLLNNNNNNNGGNNEEKERVAPSGDGEEDVDDYYEKHVQLLNYFKGAGPGFKGQMGAQAVGKGQYKRLEALGVWRHWSKKKF